MKLINLMFSLRLTPVHRNQMMGRSMFDVSGYFQRQEGMGSCSESDFD